MSTVADYRKDIVMLFRECIEGMPEGQNYTWFVQGREAIFDALAKVTAEGASRRHGPNSNSIGAHLNHVRYFLFLFSADVNRDKSVIADWEGSWTKQVFSEDEWRQLGADLKSEYAKVIGWLDSHDEWGDEDGVTGKIAVLPHAAYHLGAVRALMKVE